MVDSFAVLPAPSGWMLIELNDNAFDGNIDSWVSEPEIVLGFVVRQRQHYFSVLPVTSSDVHDEHPLYALIRPDGKVVLEHGALYTFDSINDLKVYFLRHHAECAREMAQTDHEEGNRKEAARWNRHAKKLENEAEGLEQGRLV